MRRALWACVLAAGCASTEAPPVLSDSAPATKQKPSAESGRALGVEPLAASTSSAAFVPADSCARTTHPFSTAIAVVEDSGITRYPAALSFPIAFPRTANLRSLTGFHAATPDGRALATQVEVLSRWGDGPEGCGAPIRWAYVHVLGDAAPNTRGYLAFKHDPARSTTLGPVVKVEETAEAIVVDTGAARFTVNKKRFDGLAKVEVREASGALRVLSEGTKLALDRDGAITSAAEGTVSSVELERRGPHVVTIAIKGFHAKQVFRYTVRLSFWAGSGAVLFDHTYYNGKTTDFTAHGGKQRELVDRVYLEVPLKLAGKAEVVLRGAEKVHRLAPAALVSIQQDKRSPERPNVVFSITEGPKNLELGTFADHPFLAAAAGGAYAVATIGHLGPRDPQALRFDPAKNALAVDFQSEELFVGGARGIWSKAMLDFGTGTPDLVLRGTQLYEHATRPLIGAPSIAYLNTTGARAALPAGELSGSFQQFDEDVDRIHDKTAEYLRRYRITGTQLWPDLPRTSCNPAECEQLLSGYFEGGDNNYWDWSLIELEQFLRTADPSFLHDFALPEAMTMAETISFRPDPGTKYDQSSFAGLAPCYGTARGFDGPWLEGLNHRRGACPGDYSYNKVHYLAYVLTGDRRFTDFFSQGAETAMRMYKDPRNSKPDEWLELSASRTTYQYLEPLLDAAELSRIGGDANNRRFRDRALVYFDHMVKTSLERGHTCNLLGSKHDDPKEKGDCPSDQAWMLPVWIEWVSRLARLYDHAAAKQWLIDFAKMSAQRHTVLGDGRPDLSQEQSSGGWRTMYRCIASKKTIRDDTCRKVTEIENDGAFYPNGMIAYLNAYGLVLESDKKDPAGICAWLPSAFAEALKRGEAQSNNDVWGKELGQAHAFTQTTLGALERCP